MKESPPLPHNFRKLSIDDRKKSLSLDQLEQHILSGNCDFSDLSDVLIEGSIGTLPLPFGLATGFVINGKNITIPMLTEEPSVIAAATQGASLARGGGGFKCSASESIVTTEIFIKEFQKEALKKILSSEEIIHAAVDKLTPGMLSRGGGYTGFGAELIEDEKTLVVSVHLDVRDAMGANVANTVAEKLEKTVIGLTGGRVLMAILTNSSENRTGKAEICIPEKYFRKGELSGHEVCQRIVEANILAENYPKRAVTHNKGIMNGVTALTLATGNDTRAVEAAVHFYAFREGKYRSLTHYRHENGYLIGELQLPLPIGTTGGSINIWPPAQLALKILGFPQAKEFCMILAALGLAQNLAALFALVTEGIQSGHMSFHAAKIAYISGARGNEVRAVGTELWKLGQLNETAAKKILQELKEKNDYR